MKQEHVSAATFRKRLGLPPPGADRKKPTNTVGNGVAKARDGRCHEDAIDAALTDAGYVNILSLGAEERDGLIESATLKAIYVRQFHFDPSRGWAFDFCWPFATPRFAIEREGGVHAIKSRKRKDDEKRRAAAALGWLVFPVETPDEAVRAATGAAGGGE